MPTPCWLKPLLHKKKRILEWVVISFSRGYSLSRDQTHITLAGEFFTTDYRGSGSVRSINSVWLSATLWTVTHQAPLSMEFSRQGYWSGLPLPSPGDLSDPVIEPGSCFSTAGRFFMSHQGSLAIQERRTQYLLSLLPLLLSMAIWHGAAQWSISRHLLGPSEETFVFLNDTE